LLGRPIDALISAEIGGLNAIMPLALAAISGIPVLDGDGVGRAIPHTQMCAFSIYGAPSTPCVMMDELGNEIILKISDDRTADGLIRSATDALGACAFGAFFPMTGAQTKLCSVRNTLSLCHGIGRSIREAREAPRDVFASLLAFLNVEAGRHARVLFDGKITDVTHEIRGGWHWGQVKIAALRGSEDVFTVDIKNEYLIARRNGVAVAMMPDLIAILDRETGEPITAERLHYGQRVKVLGLSADPMLRTPQALEVMGPRALQIDEDFSPLEAGPLYQVN
jgi:DUF917 family protein